MRIRGIQIILFQVWFTTMPLVILAQRYQPTLAVLGFEGLGISSAESAALTNRLRTHLMQARVYNVVEREKMQQIISEQDFSLTGCTSDECAVKIGEILGTRYILAGTIMKSARYPNSKWFIDARLIDVQTASIVDAYDFDISGDLSNAMREMEKVAKRISGLPMNINNSVSGTLKPKNRYHIGVETLVLFYQPNRSKPAGSIWVSSGATKISAGKISINVPNVYQVEGFQDQVMNISYVKIAFYYYYATAGPVGPNGFWLGTGIYSINGDIGHEMSTERVDFEYVSLELGLGYSYPIWRFDVNLWGGFLFRLLGGDDPIIIDRYSAEHMQVAPILSLDFGFHL